MRRIVEAFGVDFDQWKALTITALKLDLRTSSFGTSRAADRGRSAASRGGSARAVAGKLVYYLVLGMFMGFFMGVTGDRFLAATILFGYLILMVGLAMLVDHSAAITSPEDYGILGFQPITSRTFFASKITNALLYTLGISIALGILPASVLLFKHGPVVGAAALLALFACAITVTLAVVAGYGTLLRWAGPRRLRSWLSYVQLATGFVVYGGYFLTMDMVSESAMASFTLPRTPWLALLPPTWFASYLEVAAGSTMALDLLPVLASLGVMVALATRLRGRLSLEYAERLGELASATATGATKVRARRRPTRLWFRGGESRAVALLVFGHFRNDLRFRMGVLAILPMTVLYLLMGLRNGATSGSGAGPGDGLGFVTMAVLLFPVLLKTNLIHSESFRASWVFFATPNDRTRVIMASKNVLVVGFLLPYLAVLGVTLLFLTRDPLWVGAYILLSGSVSHLALMGVTLLDPELPFSMPVEKGRGSSRIMTTMILIGIIGGLLPLLTRVVQGSPVGLAATLAVILALTLALGPITRRRIERRAEALEFSG